MLIMSEREEKHAAPGGVTASGIQPACSGPCVVFSSLWSRYEKIASDGQRTLKRTQEVHPG